MLTAMADNINLLQHYYCPLCCSAWLGQSVINLLVAWALVFIEDALRYSHFIGRANKIFKVT